MLFIAARDAFCTLKSLLRILRKSSLRDPFRGLVPEAQTCMVLGNGPSFKKDFSRGADVIRRTPCIAVNEFSSSPLFEDLKPRYYLLADPVYWKDEASPQMSDWRGRSFGNLVTKCRWPMVVFFPSEARNCQVLHQLRSHSHLEVRLFNSTPLWGWRRILHPMFQRGLGMTRTYNVVAKSLHVALTIGYRRVILLGADHSWHEQVEVRPDNIPCVRQVHFYDRDEVALVPIYRDSATKTKPMNMVELFQRWSDVFASYHELQAYAVWLGAQVLNGSDRSFIDAFERIRLPSEPADRTGAA